MREDEHTWLEQRNAELELLVADLKAQLQEKSAQKGFRAANNPGQLHSNVEGNPITQSKSLSEKTLQAQLNGLNELLETTNAQRRKDLQGSEARYRSMVDAIHEGVLMLNLEGIIETCNASAEAILACTAEDLIAHNISDLDWQAIHENGAPFDWCNFPGLITARTGIPCSDRVIGLCKSDQQITWLSINSRPLFQPAQPLPYAVVVSFSDISSRKWMEAERNQLLEREQVARAESELAREQISQVLQSITDGFVAFDRESRFTYVNREAARMLGRPAKELLGKVLWQEFPEFAKTSFGRLYHCAVTEGIPMEVQDYYEPRRGWYSVRAYPSKSGVSLYFRNMTDSVQTARERDQAQSDRKTAEEERRESEERFRQLAENIQQIFWMYDVAEHKLIYISPVCHSVLGYDSDRCYEKTLSFWLSHIRPDDAISLKRLIRKALRGQPVEIPLRYAKPEGSERWLLVRAFPVRDRHNQIFRIAGIAEDITEQKEQELRLRLLESVIVNAHDAVVITEAEPVEPPGPKVMYVNEAFTRMLGYTPEEIIGKTPRILQGPKTDLNELKRIRQALKEWKPAIAELVNYHKDGSEVWIELSIFPVTDQPGNYTYWVGLQRDITHRKQAETEMQKALEKERELSELKSSFVSTVSHEFRTPLSTILSSADMLEFYAGNCSPEKQLEHVQRIQIAALNMKEMLNDVLLLERADARKDPFEPTSINLQSFCEALINEMRLNDQDHHPLLFEQQTPQLDLQACVDGKLLRQIFTNLLSNALKYSPPGSTVHFRLSCDERFAYFEIQDQGIGIPASDQSRLFEAFHRGTNVGMISGNGLGLAIVKQSIEIHQGRIEIRSQENEGTIVWVTLPLQPDPNSAAVTL
jgi:PAS domain S-box-containing protein